MDETEIQAISLTLSALIQALAADGVLEDERWNGLLDVIVSRLGASVDERPELVRIRADMAKKMSFYKIPQTDVER